MGGGVYGFNHKKYDFGSWQELINIIGWERLAEYDELILANDSVFGPLCPIKELFDKIEKDKEWDICGINKDVKYNNWHLSSYFLVFKKTVFNTNIFKTHIENVCPESKLADIVDKYEVPFMKKFYENGFIVKCILEKDVNIYDEWREALKFGSPFMKVKGILSDEILIKDLLYIQKEYNYPVRYIIPKIKKRFLRDIRRKLFQINIKKDRITIRLFGVYIIRKEPEKNKITVYDYNKENCPIKIISY